MPLTLCYYVTVMGDMSFDIMLGSYWIAAFTPNTVLGRAHAQVLGPITQHNVSTVLCYPRCATFFFLFRRILVKIQKSLPNFYWPDVDDIV